MSHLALVAEVTHPTRPTSHYRHMNDLLGAFSQWLRTWSAAPTTITARITALRAAFRDHLSDPLTVTAVELEAWLATPGWSDWTRVAYHGHLRSFFGWMVDSGRRVDDPTARLRAPRTPSASPRPLSPVEVDAALSVASPVQRAWLLLGMFAGLRAHEIAKLRGEDVTRDAIYVVGKGGKAAMIPTHPVLWELAEEIPRRGHWFPAPRAATGHVNPKTISTSLTRLFREVGIEGSSHRARHTYGTNLLRSGANIRVVQKLMRHSSLATTERYLDVAGDEMRDAIGRLAA